MQPETDNETDLDRRNKGLQKIRSIICVEEIAVVHGIHRCFKHLQIARVASSTSAAVEKGFAFALRVLRQILAEQMLADNLPYILAVNFIRWSRRGVVIARHPLKRTLARTDSI